MKVVLKNIVKKILPYKVNAKISHLRYIDDRLRPFSQRLCNICGYRGFFKVMGRPIRIDAKCPKCMSLERHRLLKLSIDNGEIVEFGDPDKSILHFAPEATLEKIFRENFTTYATADLFEPADMCLNIEKIEIDDASFDIVIANHVLEHVDDDLASREVRRILRPGGIFICQVPIIEGWSKTYEPEKLLNDADRWLHFGQGDHVRFYGRDFRDRIQESGLILDQEITAWGEDVVKYGLLRGEKIFVFKNV
ncbi:class I SAM-dependent methyltransferase [Planktomarina temperata]|nr:class I SAM-dependent methyltransferase [Planktomarina temperata]